MGGIFWVKAQDSILSGSDNHLQRMYTTETTPVNILSLPGDRDVFTKTLSKHLQILS